MSTTSAWSSTRSTGRRSSMGAPSAWSTGRAPAPGTRPGPVDLRAGPRQQHHRAPLVPGGRGPGLTDGLLRLTLPTTEGKGGGRRRCPGQAEQPGGAVDGAGAQHGGQPSAGEERETLGAADGGAGRGRYPAALGVGRAPDEQGREAGDGQPVA